MIIFDYREGGFEILYCVTKRFVCNGRKNVNINRFYRFYYHPQIDFSALFYIFFNSTGIEGDKRGKHEYKIKYTEKNMSNADFYNGKNFYISVTKKRKVYREGWSNFTSNVIAWNFFLSTYNKVEKRKRHDVNWEIRTIYVLFNSFNSFIVILLQLLENEFFRPLP